MAVAKSAVNPLRASSPASSPIGAYCTTSGANSSSPSDRCCSGGRFQKRTWAHEQWRAHVVRRIRRQLERTSAPGLAELLAEVESYPVPAGTVEADHDAAVEAVTAPLLLSTEHGDLSLCYVLSVFGAPRDVTLDEIAVESFFPTDDASRDLLREMGEGPSSV